MVSYMLSAVSIIFYLLDFKQIKLETTCNVGYAILLIYIYFQVLATTR